MPRPQRKEINFTKDSIIVGIDNNTWNDVRKRYNQFRNYPSRLDFFFTGWIPTIPGEVIRVDTVQDVRKYPFKVLVEAQSTMPVSQ
jgi:hypothetical protein